jgi:hypothetical protein
MDAAVAPIALRKTTLHLEDQAGHCVAETSMNETRIHIVRVPIWGIALVAALVLTLGIVAAIAAAGIFLIVFPLVLIAAAFMLVLGWLRMRLGGRGYSMSGVIETDYVVHEDASRPGDASVRKIGPVRNLGTSDLRDRD